MPKESGFQYSIQEELANGQNWLCIITGKPRSGKSYAGLRICSTIDPSFDVSRVCFSTQEFIKVLNELSAKYAGKTQGLAVMVDEAGVGVSSREFWSEKNKAMLDVLQTFGYLNLAVVWTVPDLKYIDAGCRSLFHCQVSMKKVSRALQRGLAKFYLWKTWDMKPGNILRQYPRDDLGVKIEGVQFELPPKALIEAYEKKALVYKEELRKSSGLNIDGVTAAEVKKLMSPQKIAEDILKRPDNHLFYKYVKAKIGGTRPKINEAAIQAYYDCGMGTSGKVITFLTDILRGRNKAVAIVK